MFGIKIRTIWKFQIACLKSRGFSSSVPVRYIPNTSSRVKIPETSLSVKSLQKCGFADVSVPKINGRKDGHAIIAHCETSQNPDEIHSDILLFDDSEEGKLNWFLITSTMTSLCFVILGLVVLHYAGCRGTTLLLLIHG